MIKMDVILDGEGAFTELADKFAQGQIVQAEVAAVAALSRGMSSGKPSVMFRIDLPDGRTVMAETSMRLLLVAAKAFETRYRRELED
jgi:hypothetical protein